MRHLVILLGLALAMAAVATGLLAAGCAAWNYSPGYIQVGTTIPAHTERVYAAMSLPAFAADGSYYVLNADMLLHYAAGGQRLGSSTLAVNIPAEPSEYTVWPRVYAARDGELLVNTDDRHLGLLDASQHIVWEVEGGAPVALGPGLLFQHVAPPQGGVAYMDLAGKVHWTVPGARLSRETALVDEQDRAYFCDKKALTVKQADGSEVLQVSFPEAVDGILLLDARSDRVLLGINGNVTCINLAGERLWQVAPPGGANQAISGLVLGPERFVLHKDDYPLESVIVVDGQGHVLQQSPVNRYWSLLLASESGYMAQYYAGSGVEGYIVTWGWFNADGIEQWSYQPPLPIREQHPAQGAIVPLYAKGGAPVLGPDGRIYFEINSTLYALDLQGQLVWQAAGTQFYDKWVEAQYIW